MDVVFDEGVLIVSAGCITWSSSLGPTKSTPCTIGTLNNNGEQKTRLSKMRFINVPCEEKLNNNDYIIN